MADEPPDVVPGMHTNNVRRFRAAREHPLWPAFDAWVRETGVVFQNSSHRLRAWDAYLAGYERGRAGVS